MGYLRRGAVIEAITRLRVTSDSMLLGALLFGVPRVSVPINRELIPRRHFLVVSISNLHFAPPCFALLISGQYLLPSSGRVVAILRRFFQLTSFAVCRLSSPFAEDIF